MQRRERTEATLPPGARQAERGHLLVGLVVLLAVMLIMLTAAAQSWTFLLRRDREAEMIFRGEEYARAIAFYQKENKAYPLNLDLLIKKGAHGHAYIRRLYKDPLAKDGEWGLLYLSPTGKGYINPYATRYGDPFSGGLEGQAFPAAVPGLPGQAPGSSGLAGKGRRKAGGYSELTPDEFKRLGGQTLPIVGVVHKTQETGLKIYKGQASLNDWAFTILAEGEEMNKGAGATARPTPPRKRIGLGDHTAPIFLPGMQEPPQRGGRRRQGIDDFWDQQREEERKRREEEEREKKEKSEEEGEEGSEDGEGDEEEGTEGDEDDGAASGEGSQGSGGEEEDEGSDEDEQEEEGEEEGDEPPEDPNAPHDP